LEGSSPQGEVSKKTALKRESGQSVVGRKNSAFG